MLRVSKQRSLILLRNEKQEGNPLKRGYFSQSQCNGPSGKPVSEIEPIFTVKTLGGPIIRQIFPVKIISGTILWEDMEANFTAQKRTSQSESASF